MFWTQLQSKRSIFEIVCFLQLDLILWTQVNSSPIKKLKVNFWNSLFSKIRPYFLNSSELMSNQKISIWLNFWGKNLHLVGCATVCAISEVMLPNIHTTWGARGENEQGFWGDKHVVPSQTYKHFLSWKVMCTKCRVQLHLIATFFFITKIAVHHQMERGFFFLLGMNSENDQLLLEWVYPHTYYGLMLSHNSTFCLI